MYRFRRYTAYQNGSNGDSTGYFIHYEVTGDSVIAGIRYRILVEDDLAIFNTDAGLVKIRSAYAVLSDSSGIQVKALKGEGRSTGRFPFKTSAGDLVDSKNHAFDSVHFRDEITALQLPFYANRSWNYREPGSPYGLLPANKTFLGIDTLLISGIPVSTFKFQVELTNVNSIRAYEWYADNVKVFSRTSSSTTFAGKDSSYVEEEFLGNRPFTREDTLSILKGTIFDPFPP